MKHLDAIMIGTGQAGRPWRFAGATTTVAIIERHKFGGTCVNTGCIPTKTSAQKKRGQRRRNHRHQIHSVMCCRSSLYSSHALGQRSMTNARSAFSSGR